MVAVLNFASAPNTVMIGLPTIFTSSAQQVWGEHYVSSLQTVLYNHVQ